MCILRHFYPSLMQFSPYFLSPFYFFHQTFICLFFPSCPIRKSPIINEMHVKYCLLKHIEELNSSTLILGPGIWYHECKDEQIKVNHTICPKSILYSNLPYKISKDFLDLYYMSCMPFFCRIEKCLNFPLLLRDEERRVELVSEEENQDPIKVHQAELAEWRPHTQVPTGLGPRSFLYCMYVC